MSTKNGIGFGTAAIGRPAYININTKNSTAFSNINTFKRNGIKLLKDAEQAGITHFDTSPGYGIAEDLLLAFLQESKQENISVSTKWGYTYVANFQPNPKQHEIKEHSLQKLNEQWEKSKMLLPFLNLYQIHSVTPDSDVLDNYEILHRLYEIKKNNKIAIGLSTSGAYQNEVIEKALEIKVNNEALFTSFQVTYNILDQSLFLIKNKLTDKKIIIKEALANGRILRNKNYRNYDNLYTELEVLAKKYQVGTDAIALRFCIDCFEDSIVLSGASTKEQLHQNIKAMGIKLTISEIEQLQSFAINTADYWDERKTLDWN